MTRTTDKIRAQESQPKSPAASEGGRSLVTEFQKILDRFGWRVDRNEMQRASAAQLDELSTWLDSQQMTTPKTVWHMIAIPPDQWTRLLKNIGNTKTLASAILVNRKDFDELTDPAKDLAVNTANFPTGRITILGTVICEDHPELQIWFGARAKGKPPALAGEQAELALQILFNVQPDYPPAASISNVKSQISNSKPKSKNPAAKSVARKTAATSTALSIGEAIAIAAIDEDPDNDRKSFDKTALDELADSIASVGLLQPILVTPIGDRYRIVAGARRFRACKLLARKEILARVIRGEALELDLARYHENSERENLNPIESALALQRLIDTHGLTQAEAAKRTGVQQGQISNVTRLLNLPADLQSCVAEGLISPTTIRPALPFADVANVMKTFAEKLEHATKNELPIEVAGVERWIEEAVDEHSRSMRFEANWQSYRKPDATERHFKSLLPEDLEALDVRRCPSHDGEERAFNLAKFAQLNAEPLKARKKQYNAKKPSAQKSSAPKAAKKILIVEFKHWQVEQEICRAMASGLANALKQAKDPQAVTNVCLALAFTSQICVFGSAHQHPEKATQMALAGTAGDANKICKSLLPKFIANLKDIRLYMEQSITLAARLGVNLVAAWKPTQKLLECLTPDGLEACADELGITLPAAPKAANAMLLKSWQPGVVPSFLHAAVGVPKMKAKESKAA